MNHPTHAPQEPRPRRRLAPVAHAVASVVTEPLLEVARRKRLTRTELAAEAGRAAGPVCACFSADRGRRLCDGCAEVAFHAPERLRVAFSPVRWPRHVRARLAAVGRAE